MDDYFNVMFIRDNLDLDTLLSRLDFLADRHHIKRLRLNLCDYIFRYTSKENFSMKCNKFLKRLVICFICPRIYVSNEEEKIKLIKKFHDDPIYGGHCGQKRLIAKIKSEYKWKNMAREISRFVKACQDCQLNKSHIHTREPLTITPTPQKPFDLIIMDTIGPLPTSDNGYKYALTVICDLTKFLFIIPIRDKEASTVARALFSNFIIPFGIFREVRTDRGTEFKNELLSELCKLLKVEHKISTPYRHETVGTIERNHRILNEYLRSYINSNHTLWDEYVKYFNYCYNTTPSPLLRNYSPFELVFGRTPYNPPFLSKAIEPVYNIDNYVHELRYRLQCAHELVRRYLNLTKQSSKNRYDKGVRQLNLNIGDSVLLRNEAGHKLDPVYKGPYKVREIVSDTNVTISDESMKNKLTVHKNRLCKFFI